MAKPRIVIADTDDAYLQTIALKFIEEYFEKIDLELITDPDFLEKQFETLQKVDILIISENLYNPSFRKHNIGSLVIMTETNQEEGTAELDINLIYKYTSIKEIFNEIMSEAPKSLDLADDKKNDPQIVMVYSPAGGTGKTTVALGIAHALSKKFKKVLYIDAERFHTFQHYLSNETPISSNDVYSKLVHAEKDVYGDIKHVIRNEVFSYLPPFKAPLMSFGIPMGVYANIALGAKKSMDYDFIIIDSDSVLDEEKGILLNSADKVLIVTQQSEMAVYATVKFVESITGVNDDKYFFICNAFDKDSDNLLISPDMHTNFNVSHYIERFHTSVSKKVELFAENSDIQKSAMLIL